MQLLSISFDSAHDTPAALQTYAQQLQADPTLWRLVRLPDAAQMQQLLQRASQITNTFMEEKQLEQLPYSLAKTTK